MRGLLSMDGPQFLPALLYFDIAKKSLVRVRRGLPTHVRDVLILVASVEAVTRISLLILKILCQWSVYRTCRIAPSNPIATGMPFSTIQISSAYQIA